MARPRLWTILLVASALLCLSACDSATTAISASMPTPTILPSATPTATLIPAPTPSNVPSGWSVAEGLHFSLAFPTGLKFANKPDQNTPNAIYNFFVQPSAIVAYVSVTVYPQAQSSMLDGYCQPVSADNQHVTLAGLPMNYTLTGEAQSLRGWFFVNSQHTAYTLIASDAGGDAVSQSADDAILATFTPDDAAPLSC